MIETADDLAEFFLTEDFAVDCLLTGPSGYSKTIAVILNTTSDPVALYETNVEAPTPHFICRAVDLVDLQRRQLKQHHATIESITYELERVADDQDGKLCVVYLKKPYA
jgi:tRNA pseudouridine-54 N-methylase